MAKKQFSLSKLSIPIFWDLFFRFLSVIASTAMVSHYSNNLVGAMGAGNEIIDLFITVFSFLSVGCSVVVAQAIGAKDTALARKVIHQSLFLNLLVGLVCGSFILWQSEFLLHLLNIPQELLKDSQNYLDMLAICLVFDAVGLILSAIIRVYNKAYWVMLVGFMMDIIVVIGNFYVLHFTQLELFGVGVSNIVARVVAVIAMFLIVVYKLKIHLKIKEMLKLEKDVLKKVFSIGGFSAGENLIWISQYIISFSFVASLGKENLSVQTIYFQLSLLIMMVGIAMSVANEIIVGKLVGARHENIAYKHTWQALYFSVIVTILVVLIHYSLKDFTMNLLDLKQVLREIMLPLFTLSIFLEIARTFNIVMVNALRASGDAKFPFFSGMVFMLGVSLPVGYILCFHYNLGILGIWIGYCADESLRGLVNAYRWKSKKWQGKALV
ncbi:MATE family efflux transporter [Campylobacter estrildidarum]|uniref:MATE family efflux transporter n=1 Tax=Campylobacter estrildidarum TaxID=2510189 RepID=A0A4U7BJD5_9BACT|nr:MATE family efflux transporter [Campylobacter estrildidarum]TKX32003.1 MATE family efflux transporter [Campylobacter estrildidarum]